MWKPPQGRRLLEFLTTRPTPVGCTLAFEVGRVLFLNEIRRVLAVNHRHRERVVGAERQRHWRGVNRDGFRPALGKEQTGERVAKVVFDTDAKDGQIDAVHYMHGG